MVNRKPSPAKACGLQFTVYYLQFYGRELENEIQLSVLLLVPLLPQALFALMRRHFVAFALFAAGHVRAPYLCVDDGYCRCEKEITQRDTEESQRDTEESQSDTEGSFSVELSFYLFLCGPL